MRGPSRSIRKVSTRIVSVAMVPVTRPRPAAIRPFESVSEFRSLGKFFFAQSCAPTSWSQCPICPFPFSAWRIVRGRSSVKVDDAS